MASPNKTAKKSAPKTLDIVIEAIKAVDDRKGVSIQAIKTYVLENYPDKDPNMIKTSLKKAIQKGFEEELIVRPAKSEITGPSMSGRLKLNKTKMAEQEKVAKAKAKKAEQKKEKPEKSPATKKKTPAKKSPAAKKKPDAKKSPKKKTSEKTTKSKTKSPVKTKKKAAAKTPKTPEKTKAKTKKVTKTPMKTSKSAKNKGRA